MMVESFMELPDYTTVEIHSIDGDLFAMPSEASPRHRGSRDRSSRVAEVMTLNEELAEEIAISAAAFEAQLGRRYKDTLAEGDLLSPYADIQFPALFEEEFSVFGVEVGDMPPSPSFKLGSDEESSSETSKHRSQSKRNRNLPANGKRRRPQVVEIVDIHPILVTEEVEIELSEHRRTPKRPVSPQSLSHSHVSAYQPYAPPTTPQPNSTASSSNHGTFAAPTPRRGAAAKREPGTPKTVKDRKDKKLTSSPSSAGISGASASKDELNVLREKAAGVDIRTLSFAGEEVLRISQATTTEETDEVDVGDDFDC